MNVSRKLRFLPIPVTLASLLIPVGAVNAAYSLETCSFNPSTVNLSANPGIASTTLTYSDNRGITDDTANTMAIATLDGNFAYSGTGIPTTWNYSCAGGEGGPPPDGTYIWKLYPQSALNNNTFTTGDERCTLTVNVACEAPSTVCEGFFAPVDRSPTVNKANAGRTIPLKWRCTNGDGVPVTQAPESFGVKTVVDNCTSGVLTDDIEAYAPGSSGLINDGNGYWHYNWQTLKDYANKCVKTTVEFDGATISADFQFKK